jgi:hypothetical protein
VKFRAFVVDAKESSEPLDHGVDISSASVQTSGLIHKSLDRHLYFVFGQIDQLVWIKFQPLAESPKLVKVNFLELSLLPNLPRWSRRFCTLLYLLFQASEPSREVIPKKRSNCLNPRGLVRSSLPKALLLFNFLSRIWDIPEAG